MVRKKISKIIMLISIISAVLLITPSFGTASDADILKPKEPLPEEDSGRIGLDETATEQEPVYPIDPAAGTTGFDDGGNMTGDASGEDEESSMEELIWLIVNGDELPDGDNGELDGNSSSSDEMNLGGSLAGETLEGNLVESGSEIEVDEIFIASANGVVDEELAIGTSLPLNIIGHVRINVLEGDVNPYFDGYDVIDNTAFAITTSSAFLALSVAKLLYEFGVPILKSVQFGIYATTKVLDAILTYIETKEFQLIIDFTFGGLNIQLNLRGTVFKTIMMFVQPILDLIELHLEISLSDVIQSIIDALQDDDGVESTFSNFITGAIPLWVGIGAMIKVLRGKPYYPDIYDWLTDENGPDLSSFKANQVISFLQTSDDVFTSLRVNTIGQFDVFVSHGATVENNEYIQLRNLHVDVENGVEDGYAAIVEIEAISAGNVFDSKIIGIVYDGNGDGDDVGMVTETLNSEPVVGGSTSTTETTGSSTTQMSGTTGSTSL